MMPQAHQDHISSSHYNVNNDDIHDLRYAKRGCCFWIPFLNTEPSTSSSLSSDCEDWKRIKPVESTSGKESWWKRGWKKIRDWSELVAGPRWKTFLRRINRKQNSQMQYRKFNYDASSYALNFDEGSRYYDDDDLLGRGFSSRYSLPPSAKTSLDFDREGLTFT